MNNRSIGINQRIPLDVLHLALEGFLIDTYSEDYILEQLRLEFKGENRLKKSLNIINKIVLRSPLSRFINDNREELKSVIKKRNERNLILISLLNSTFEFSFDALQFLGKFLSVQDLINTETIKKSLSNKYGGNRATENALYSVLPMFLEAGLIIRPTLGIYSKNDNFLIFSEVSKQAYIQSFNTHNKLDHFLPYHLQDPYFLFIRD